MTSWTRRDLKISVGMRYRRREPGTAIWEVYGILDVKIAPPHVMLFRFPILHSGRRSRSSRWSRVACTTEFLRITGSVREPSDCRRRRLARKFARPRGRKPPKIGQLSDIQSIIPTERPLDSSSSECGGHLLSQPLLDLRPPRHQTEFPANLIHDEREPTGCQRQAPLVDAANRFISFRGGARTAIGRHAVHAQEFWNQQTGASDDHIRDSRQVGEDNGITPPALHRHENA